MLESLKNPVYRLRSIALIEGFSFLLLLFVSMPLKYYMGMATFSYYVGLSHGYLFITYIILATETLIRRRISIEQFRRVLIASIIPFGTFFNDKMLKNQQEKISVSSS